MLTYIITNIMINVLEFIKNLIFLLLFFLLLKQTKFFQILINVIFKIIIVV